MKAGGWATQGGEPLRPGARVYAGAATVLKKSTEISGLSSSLSLFLSRARSLTLAASGGLPEDQKLRVGLGSPCIVVNATLFDGYLLCIHHIH